MSAFDPLRTLARLIISSAGDRRMRFNFPRPLHGWRAFIGEVGVVVFGVLLALAGAQLVDTLQWRTKVQRAEQSMRLELGRDDGAYAYGRIAVARCLDQRINRIFHGAGRAPTAELSAWIDDYAPPIRLWDSEAWKAVLASDVGSHIGAEDLIGWSASYRLIPAMSEANQREGEVTTELKASLPASGNPSPTDLQSVRRNAALLSVLNSKMFVWSSLLLSRMNKEGARVPLATAQTLRREARESYGSCMQVPNPNAPATQNPIFSLRNDVWRPLAGSSGPGR